MDIKLNNHSAFNINYHIVFCPKRRKPVLVGDVALHCKDIYTKICEKLNLKIESISIQPDHVHIFVSAHPKISPHKIVKAMKGASSNILRKCYPQLLKLPALWSGAYYVGTIGSVSESIVKLYIENQKGK